MVIHEIDPPSDLIITRGFTGHDLHTTNNRMEMVAAIAGLVSTPEGSAITLYSDSAYMVNGFLQDWLSGWKKRHWFSSAKRPVINRDLWQTLDRLTSERQVTWAHIRGHQGNYWNEVCDVHAGIESAKALALKEAQCAT